MTDNAGKKGYAEHSGGKATCTQNAVCEFCKAEYGEKLPHDFTAETVDAKYLKSAATCTEKAVYYKSCAACGLSSAGTASEATFEAGNVLGHDWGAWTSNGNDTHTRVCSRDASHTETDKCHGGEASCTMKAVCEVCKAEYGEKDPEHHAEGCELEWVVTETEHEQKYSLCGKVTIAKEKLGLADLRAIDADVTAAEKMADGMTAWRIEGTLREFARFDPVNLWFDYPVHKPDSGLLEDLQPDSDFKTLGSRGASKRWGDKGKVTKDKKAELDTAFEACMMDGEVTVYALAEYMDLKPRTIKTRLKDDGRFWIDGEKVGRKEPGSAG